MTKLLHEKQLAALRFISREYVLQPNLQEVRVTLRDIGKAIGVKGSGHVSYHVRKLEELGYIKRIAQSSYIVLPLSKEIGEIL